TSEAGVTCERETDGGHVYTWLVPEPLLRVGVFERAELRLSADGFVSIHQRGEPTENTGSDLELSTKVRLVEQHRWLPATSVLAGVCLPTGGHAVTSGGYDPFGMLLASWGLGEGLSLVQHLRAYAEAQV